MGDIAAGVCLTFDDLFVGNWLAARPLFRRAGATVSFCVTRLHTAGADQIDGLRRLRDDGHEITHHSRTHPRLRPYLESHGLDRWLAEEVEAGTEDHRRAGFPATSFACPFHASTPETRQALGARFEVVRVKGPRRVTADRLARRIYAAPDRNRAVHNIGSIDFRHEVQGGWDWLGTILDAIRDRGGVGVFTGHDIRAEAGGAGFYSTRDDIARLLDAVAARGLRFYTLTGFARAARAGG